MYWDPQACHWDMLGAVAPVLGYAGIHSLSYQWDVLESTAPALDVIGCLTSGLAHAGTQGCYTGACPGVIVPSLALGCGDIHGPSTGTCWIPQPRHWDVLGCIAFILELSRAPVSGTGTYWMHSSCAGIHWGSRSS